jgi:hypothetical protein
LGPASTAAFLQAQLNYRTRRDSQVASELAAELLQTLPILFSGGFGITWDLFGSHSPDGVHLGADSGHDLLVASLAGKSFELYWPSGSQAC